jgi:TolA-binding protein
VLTPLRLIQGQRAPGRSGGISATWWIAAVLQVTTLMAGCVLWPAPPRQPASGSPALARAEETSPGPVAPARIAATPRPARVTAYPPASVEVLLSAGERAQLVGHPQQAIGFYDQILRENPADPRAAEAAFTAGRLLLHALSRPRQAAERFAQARRLAPHGPMAEDALAQEIESWARAGKTARARARVEEFRALYPSAPLPELVDVQGG